MGGARRLGSLAVTAGLAMLLVRCGRLEGADSPNTGAEDGSAGEGGSGSDANGAVDAGGDVAGASSILPNGTFDTGCQNWQGYQADLTPEPNGQHGQGCRVCVNAGADLSKGFSIDTKSFPRTPGTWNAEIAVHAVDVPNSAGYRLQPVLRTYDDPANPGGTLEDFNAAQLQTIGPQWVTVSVALTATKPASYIDFYVYMVPTPPAGTCFAVDDAKLFPPP